MTLLFVHSVNDVPWSSLCRGWENALLSSENPNQFWQGWNEWTSWLVKSV